MIYCKELIVNESVIAGDGTIKSPHRGVVKVFNKDGTLIAEKDPLGNFTIEDFFEFEILLNSGYTINDFKKIKRNITTL